MVNRNKTYKQQHWKLLEYDIDFKNELIRTLQLKAAIAQLFATRGFTSVENVAQFLNPSLQSLPAPRLLKDMHKAVDRLTAAISSHEKIAIYGDYDADGITACAVMVLFLNEVGANVTYFLPERLKDGYSLNKEALEELKGNGIKLVVTVDCGISDHELIEYGKGLGLDFIVTDHHLPPERIPEACAVVDPKRKDCQFPFKEMAGVGVAFYTLIELRSRLRDNGYFASDKEPNLKQYLDLVSIGTVADMMPLLGPNRVFVKYGLQEIENSKKTSIRLLREELLTGSPDVRGISHRIAPRINAPGRMSTPVHSLELLLSSDEQRVTELIKTLNLENQRRQGEEEKIIRQALKMIEESGNKPCYVLYSPDWHLGVLGIVASKLLERLNRPFFVLADDNKGMIRGSARSVDEFPLKLVLDELSDYLEEYGGHEVAAGVTLKKDMLQAFSDAVESKAREHMNEKKYCKFYEIDSILEIGEIDDQFFDQISSLEPFGYGNSEPVFLINNVIVENARTVGSKENHLKLHLSKDEHTFSAIGFFMDGDLIQKNITLDIIGVPKINEYNGIKKWDFYLKDYCIGEV